MKNTNNDLFTRKEALMLATNVVGMSCQSTVLTMISDCGNKKILQPAQEITGYEIVEVRGGVELLLTLGGENVLIDTCLNFA